LKPKEPAAPYFFVQTAEIKNPGGKDREKTNGDGTEDGEKKRVMPRSGDID
jgi:hypothetical protein